MIQNIPSVLKWEFHKNFCVNYILEIRFILNMPQFFNIPSFWYINGHILNG